MVLKMLRNIARATNMEEHISAIRTLEESAIWNKNDALKQWFSKKWMPEIQKWAHVYRTGLLNFGINTNNGLERQHEVLKYNYLDGYKNCTLSEMITVLHRNFFPSTYRKYVESNLKCSQYYRKYSEDVPKFLWNRPRDFIKKVMKKMTSNLDESDIICINSESGAFKVSSETTKGLSYDVVLTGVPPMCTCLYWKNYFLPCKHMCCIFKYVDGWGWDTLNSSYRNNPLFILDTDILEIKTEHDENSHEKLTKPFIDIAQMHNFEELPPRRRTKRTTLIRSYAQTVKQLTDLVYLIHDNSHIETLISSVQNLVEASKLKVPKESGLPLIETPKKKIQLTEKYEPLPKRVYGKPKQPASHRVGEKAELLRQDVWQSVDCNAENYEMKDACEENIQNKDDTWVTINGIRLTYNDRDIIANGEWLDDNIINACQHLLSQKFPSVGGLCDTLLVAHNATASAKVDNVIQIHHLGDHWVVSHCSESVVNVYDSMKPIQIANTLKMQMTKMYAPLFSGENSTLDVNFKCCQKQRGCNDCGLFSIANAVSLANDISLNTIQFDQWEMRNHLIKCIERQEISMFPHVNKSIKMTTKKIKMTTFCVCKMHNEKKMMIECTSCRMWFHLDCVGLQSHDKCITTRRRYFCPECTKIKK
ncbi:uncharacterized protein LOC134970050 [Pseudophryne corroboree]|uniref:uncharacterized protein LOC134970050 n=1 Tax=Pseudophryne corroboree TaxID=495146 RepID=UPI0030812F38